MIYSIDPGATGAIAVFYPAGTFYALHRMPKTKTELHSFIADNYAGNQFVLEDVGRGIAGNSMQSVATFAMRRATLDTLLVVHGLLDRTFFYTPNEWQRPVKEFILQKSNKPRGTFRLPKLTKEMTRDWVISQIGQQVPLAHADAVAIGLYHLNHAKENPDVQRERREEAAQN